MTITDAAADPAAKSTPAAPRPEAPSAPALTPSSSGLDQARTVAAEFAAWLSRPRVRLALIGAILLLTGGVFMTNSVWTLPLVVAGALMVAIAWIGRRLDGRFAVEWGEGGTQLEFRAKIKAPALPRPVETSASASAHDRSGVGDPESGQSAIIEGQAHTVEIEVSELEALIAAVQTTNGHSRDTEASGQVTPSFQVVRGAVGSPQNPASPRTTR